MRFCFLGDTSLQGKLVRSHTVVLYISSCVYNHQKLQNGKKNVIS